MSKDDLKDKLLEMMLKATDDFVACETNYSKQYFEGRYDALLEVYHSL